MTVGSGNYTQTVADSTTWTGVTDTRTWTSHGTLTVTLTDAGGDSAALTVATQGHALTVTTQG